jgi:hypothetical protein
MRQSKKLRLVPMGRTSTLSPEREPSLARSAYECDKGLAARRIAPGALRARDSSRSDL